MEIYQHKQANGMVKVTFIFQNKQKEPAFGADVLRWWAAMSCLQTTTTIGNNKLSVIFNDIFEVRIIF